MNYIKTIISFLLFICFIYSASAQTLDQQKKALDIIADFAEKICGKTSTTGETNNLELSAEAKAELGKVLERIYGIGIDAAAIYQNGSFNNVLQKDLLEDVKITTDCKNQVSKRLEEKLLSSNTYSKSSSAPKHTESKEQLHKIPNIATSEKKKSPEHEEASPAIATTPNPETKTTNNANAPGTSANSFQNVGTVNINSNNVKEKGN
ncbi:MAG: hypothetical protein WCG16_14285 [Methylococcales bacterium]